MVELSQIKGNAIIPPKNKYQPVGGLSMDDDFIFKVRKIYEEDVKYINALILNEAKIGIIFMDKEKVLESRTSFNERIDTKQKYQTLEELL